MAYYSLPTGKLHKKTETKKLNNLPSNVETDFYKSWLEYVDLSFDSNSQQKTVSEAKNKDIKNYLLTTSEFGKHMQEDIDMYITRDRLNEAGFRRKLHPMTKNVIRWQNHLEVVKTFQYLTCKTQ